MVKIENLTELKQELERRKKWVEDQKADPNQPHIAAHNAHVRGMVYAFGEAISMVNTLLAVYAPSNE